jgi:hypothetical protein
MRQRSLIVLLLFYCSVSKAQLMLGFEAGVSDNTVSTDIAGQSSTAINARAGYYFSSKVQVGLCKWLYIAAMPGIIQKGFRVNRTDSLTGIYTDYKNAYVQVPLMLHAVTGKKLKYYLDAGLFAGYWIDSKVKGVIPDIFNEFKLVPYARHITRDKKMEFGYVAGAGIQYHSYFLACRYYYAVSNQLQDGFRYNQTVTISIGTVYTLK